MEASQVLQRWRVCIACDAAFEKIIYRCLQCSDLQHNHSKNNLNTSEPTSPRNTDKNVHPSDETSAANNSQSARYQGAFHVCPACVRKASIFHPIRHVFIRIDFTQVQKVTKTSNVALRSSEDKLFAFESHEKASCTGPTDSRRHLASVDDAAKWENYVHQKIISVPHIKTLKTSNHKLHKPLCDRCNAKIYGVRWERLCAPNPQASLPPAKSNSGTLSKQLQRTEPGPTSPNDPNRHHGQAETSLYFSDEISHSTPSSLSSSLSTNSHRSSKTPERSKGSSVQSDEAKHPTPLSLCVLCFDTLFSDFISPPYGHKTQPHPDHDDSYFHGHLWAQIRCLFDSISQPLIDVDEVAGVPKSAVVVGPSSLSPTSTNIGVTYGTGSGTGSGSMRGTGYQSRWEKRHGGSDHSTSSTSSPLSQSNPPNDILSAITSTIVNLNDVPDDMEEWVLMDLVAVNPYISTIDSTEGEIFNDSPQIQSESDSSDEDNCKPLATLKSVLDTARQQTISFIEDDDIMRPAEVTKALEPLIPKTKPTENNLIPALPEDVLQPQEDPVFEIPADLREQLANKKLRSVFVYGFDEPAAPLPTSNPIPLAMPYEEKIQDPPTEVFSPPNPYRIVIDPIPEEASVVGSDSASERSASLGYADPTTDTFPSSQVIAGIPPLDHVENQVDAPHNDLKPLDPEPAFDPALWKAPIFDASTGPSNNSYFSTEPIIPKVEETASSQSRDWNSEFQTLVAEAKSKKMDFLSVYVTTPDLFSTDKDSQINGLLNDINNFGTPQIIPLLLSLLGSNQEKPLSASLNNPELSQSISENMKRAASSLHENSDSSQQISPEQLERLTSDPSAQAQLIVSIIKLRRFINEFTETATRLAKRIVDEVTLPIELKSIKPKQLGGIAGGEKFLEDGIFFKFAIDAYGVYGGDKFALKAAGHEMKGLKAYLFANVAGLCVPLSTVIDYAGYRIVASAKLPISEKTLIYGSSDGGAVIHKDDPLFNRMMENAAIELNIKQHEVAPGVSLHSAIDVEGHFGLDRRYYVLDTARVFPPEPPLRTFVAVVIPSDTTTNFTWSPSPPIFEIELIAQRHKWIQQVKSYLKAFARRLPVAAENLYDGQVFHLQDPHRSLPLNSRASALVTKVIRGPAIYVVEPGQRSTQLFNLLRPEFVIRQPHPLSSDAFTSFGRIDEDTHNTEVEDAFYRLLGIDIVQFVKTLTSLDSYEVSHEGLIEKIKSFGINLRLLGFVRSHLTSNRAIRSVILVEMVTRVAKNNIRATLRHARRKAKAEGLSPELANMQAKEIMLATFNLILGNSPSAVFMWQCFLKPHLICKFGQYGQALNESELDPQYDLRDEINKLQLFQTLQTQLGVQFKDEVCVRFQNNPRLFEVSAPFGPSDIDCLVAKTKQLLDEQLKEVFMGTLPYLPSALLRLEAIKGFFGSGSREIAYASLMLTHMIYKASVACQPQVPLVLDHIFKVFQNPGSTPAEITYKGFFMLGYAHLNEGRFDMAEANLKAAYLCYRRALANHVASKPFELGRPFLLLILDRLAYLMNRQNRKFEAWYYAHKFIKIWHSIPYPGLVRDLEVFFNRPIPLSFALLWERDHYLSCVDGCTTKPAIIKDSSGNPSTVLSRKSTDDLNKFDAELTPEMRLKLEKVLFTAPASDKVASAWRSSMKMVEFSQASGFNMAPSVLSDYISRGDWILDRGYDSRILEHAIWSPIVHSRYQLSVPASPPKGRLEGLTSAVLNSPHSPLPAHLLKPSTLSFSTSAAVNSFHNPSPEINHSTPSLPPPNKFKRRSMVVPISPMPEPTIDLSTHSTSSPIQGTINSPYFLKSGHVPQLTFNWHISKAWLGDVVGTEKFVLVRLDPSFWVVPALIPSSKSTSSCNMFVKNGDKPLIRGSEVGEYVEHRHEIIASAHAPIHTCFGQHTFKDLDLPWGTYQILLVTVTGHLWGLTTSTPGFIISNPIIVLNNQVRRHVLSWDEETQWAFSASQAQGIELTSLAMIPLDHDHAISYWTDANKNLWYGFYEANVRNPEYLMKNTAAGTANFQILHPIVMPTPSDFAQTIKSFVSSLGAETQEALLDSIVAGLNPNPALTGKPSSARQITTYANLVLVEEASSDQEDDVKQQQPALTNPNAAFVTTELVTMSFDSNGIRVSENHIGNHTSVICTKQIESRLTPHTMWTKMRKIPTLVSEKVVKVTASASHIIALLENGDVYTWGSNTYGELGHGDTVRLEEPRIVKRLRGKVVRDIFCGTHRSAVVLSSNRSVYQWGLDFSYFPEPHSFWKTQAEEEVCKVVFASHCGDFHDMKFESISLTSMPSIPREPVDYFASTTLNNPKSLWDSLPVLYLTDTGRVHVYAHDPQQTVFNSHKPHLLDIFENAPIVSADIGTNFFVFVSESGEVFTTGENDVGQLGLGSKWTMIDTASHAHQTSRTNEQNDTRRNFARYRKSNELQRSNPDNKPFSDREVDTMDSNDDWNSNSTDFRRDSSGSSDSTASLNRLCLPKCAAKVSFDSDAKIAKVSVRNKKVWAISTTGKVYHWGHGVFEPALFTPLEHFTVVDLLATVRGASFHTGTHPRPLEKLSDKGKSRRKTLGISERTSYLIKAKEMLKTPQGLKPYYEGAEIPPGSHAVVVVDWERPSIDTIDRGEVVRWVSPGSDTLLDLPDVFKEIGKDLPVSPLKSGRIVFDYLQPTVSRCTIKQGIANGYMENFLNSQIQWESITPESKEALLKRKARRSHLISYALLERQERYYASIPTSASPEPFSTVRNFDKTGAREKLKELLAKPKHLQLNKNNSASTISRKSSSTWDPSAAFIDIDSAASDASSSSFGAQHVSLSAMELDQEEFALQMPPGEYQAVYCFTKPQFKIVARSDTVTFSFDGIVSVVDVESDTVLGDQPVTVHWKTELKMNGISLVLRSGANPEEVLRREHVKLRDNGVLRWKLPGPGSYQIHLEQVDPSGTHRLASSPWVECISNISSQTGFSNANSFVAAVSRLSGGATCKTWTEFFQQCNFPPEIMNKYVQLVENAALPIEFCSCLDTGMLDKIGINSIQHQVAILLCVKEQKVQAIRNVVSQELHNLCIECETETN